MKKLLTAILLILTITGISIAGIKLNLFDKLFSFTTTRGDSIIQKNSSQSPVMMIDN